MFFKIMIQLLTIEYLNKLGVLYEYRQFRKGGIVHQERYYDKDGIPHLDIDY